MDPKRLNQALTFAARAHQGQYRKGTDIPYIIHPVAIAFMLQELGCEDDLIIAGLLHDVVEDTPVTLDDVEQSFGRRVAFLVREVSEPDRSAPWEVRKRHTIEQLREAPLPVKILACTDKLHNLRTVAQDYAEAGDVVWQRFKRGKAQQAWYYHNLKASLFYGLDKVDQYPVFGQFAREVEALFGQAKERIGGNGSTSPPPED